MTVLYGTVEYFKKQISDYVAINQTKTSEEEIWNIFSKLKNEIVYDPFMNDKKIRGQFLKNLKTAISQLSEQHSRCRFNE